MLKVNKRSDGPPDGFRYRVPETGHLQTAYDMETLMFLIKEDMRRNSIPVPDNLREIAEDQACQLLPPGWCRQSDGGQPIDFINTRLGLDDVLRGTAVVSEIIARRVASVVNPDASPFVEQSVAEDRAAKCAACYARVPVQGCLSCQNFTAVVSAIIGNRTTKADVQLETSSCAICKCAAKSHVWIRSDILANGIDDAMQSKFATIPNCWKAKCREEALTESQVQISTAP